MAGSLVPLLPSSAMANWEVVINKESLPAFMVYDANEKTRTSARSVVIKFASEASVMFSSLQDYIPTSLQQLISNSISHVKSELGGWRKE